MRFAVPVLLSLSLAACGALPSEGPGAIDISAEKVQADAALTGYSLVPLDPASVQVVNAYRPQRFASQFLGVGNGGSTSVLGVGDSLKIGIWEATSEGLFTTSDSGVAMIPAVVDEGGFVFVPYAGRIRAAGLTVEGLRQSIQEKLVGKAVEPQVVVTLGEKLSTTAVVVGDAAKPGVYPLPNRTVRLLDLIASAGGARQATYETEVTLKRGQRSGTIRLENLIEYPENNVTVSPGDTVLLLHQPRTFSVFGATKQNTLVPFKTKDVTLAEGLATVGGLLDSKANAGGIFLFRYEDVALARSLDPKLSADLPPDRAVPVVYRLDLKDPRGFFLAREFELRDKDILYVSNHPTAEFGKFLNIISPLLTTARNVDALTD
ncbi:polysaccharide biosynthesis/export family protein [Roseibium aestuarii]|uniref:Polysaccharide biosynthesis/export family protein n=1 Tax=Roseibium aestuarii TaxID=2600299 RepID=A0ABW4JRZ7_9HYPH|nr:polysaccharide biosynthesis/export family protein [Roseibium aestuarii]